MFLSNDPDLQNILARIHAKTDEAEELYGSFASGHEFYGVLLEEIDELWDEIKKRPYHRDATATIKEAIDVAAVVIRFAYQVSREGLPK